MACSTASPPINVLHLRIGKSEMPLFPIRDALGRDEPGLAIERGDATSLLSACRDNRSYESSHYCGSGTVPGLPISAIPTTRIFAGSVLLAPHKVRQRRLR